MFEQEWLPAADVPWFVTVFGRDSLIVSLQNMFVNCGFALARWSLCQPCCRCMIGTILEIQNFDIHSFPY